MLKVILDVVGDVEENFCSCCLIVIDLFVQDVDDNKVSYDTKLNWWQ